MKRLFYPLILTLCSIAFLISCGNNGSNYAWLEGVWEGEDENGNWAVAEISPNGYKYACSIGAILHLTLKIRKNLHWTLKLRKIIFLRKRSLL